MLTQIVTILIFVSIIGCILYGRRLIQTEKVDAVFGNPERAKGGTHWVIVGSAAILLVWLYYSWDIAKGFYPKSANELCQVAKINESLLGLKYQFPIEEREFKSTSIIKIENENLKKINLEITNSQDISNQQKIVLSSFIKKTSILPGIMILPRHILGGRGFKAPSDKLNIAGVGVRKWGMGSANLDACSGENIVALCDVDYKQSAPTFKKYLAN